MFFDNTENRGHESIHHFSDPKTGLKAIIAIHSTTLGPAGGGCRMWHYQNEADALTDALRLSRGMTYKNAMAGLAMGGGKAVILADPEKQTDTEFFESFGRCVDSLGGRYITAEDVGVTVENMRQVHTVTEYVAGLPSAAGSAGGDPSPWTANGVFMGIQAAVSHRLQRDSFAGLRVAVQGIGKVGYDLCRQLHAAGAELLVSDVNAERLERARTELGAKIISPAQILSQKVDVLAPCAMGAILDAQIIAALNTTIVAGAANNQLATEADGQRLSERHILYAPDYVINGGGIISVAMEHEGNHSTAEVNTEIAKIPDRLTSIFKQASIEQLPTNIIADKMAESIVAAGVS